MRTEVAEAGLEVPAPGGQSGGEQTLQGSPSRMSSAAPPVVTAVPAERDLRLDLFRGIALWLIFLDHIPTNIVVQCQNDRSQHRNRAEAMSMLKARLFELEMRKRNEEKQALEDSKTDIGWGHQIRSYVLDQSQIGRAHV